jgi:hypothetical protein
VFNGRRIDWQNWDTYVPEFICRCAKQAKEFQRQVFGLQFYGECLKKIYILEQISYELRK